MISTSATETATRIEMIEASSASPIQTAEASQTLAMRTFSRWQAEGLRLKSGESGHENGHLLATGQLRPYRQTRAVGVISPYRAVKGELHPHRSLYASRRHRAGQSRTSMSALGQTRPETRRPRLVRFPQNNRHRRLRSRSRVRRRAVWTRRAPANGPPPALHARLLRWPCMLPRRSHCSLAKWFLSPWADGE